MSVTRQQAMSKGRRAALGLTIGAVLWLTWTILTRGECPLVRLELLPVAKWGFGGLPPGTAYYFNPGHMCVFFFGNSRRLGVVRVITHVREGNSLAIPPVRTPPSAK